MHSKSTGVFGVLWAPWEGSRAKSQRLYLSSSTSGLKIAGYELFYTRRIIQNKQISASKDNMKALWLVQKVCYFKNGLIYLKKINTTILLCDSFKLKKFVFFSLKKYVRTVRAMSTKSITYEILGTKLNVRKLHRAADRTVFHGNVLENLI